MMWIGRLAVVLALAAGIAAGDELSGQVIDATGEPVGGAEVWVTGVGAPQGNILPDGELLATTTTNEDGRFELTYEPVQNVGPQSIPAMVAAHKPGLALGWGMLPEGTGAVTLRLEAPTATSMLITDEADAPLAGVRVAMLYVMSLDRLRQSQPAFFFAPAELRERLSWDGGDEGRVEFDLLPAGCMAAFRIATPDRGTVITLPTVGSEIRVPIGAPASLTGRVTGPEADALGGLTVTMMGVYPEGWNPLAGDGYMAQVEASTDTEGRFAVETLPPGTYRITVRLGENPEWLMTEQAKFTAESGEAVADLESAMQRGWPVTGRFVRAGTGEPVAGVTVMASGGGGVSSSSAETDEEGRFTLYALPGRVRLYARPPKEYLERQVIEPVDVVAETGATVDDIELERAATVTGVVVDEAGEPVPGAEVWASITRPPDPDEDAPPAPAGAEEMRVSSVEANHTVADGAGRFEFTRLPPGSEVTLHAATMTAVTARAVKVVATAETEPLELVVSEEVAGFATGRVVDDEGRPMVGQTVGVFCHMPREGGRSSITIRQVTTDAEGHYETGALVAGMNWQTTVGRGAFQKVGSEEWVCARGETHQIPDIVIDVAGGTLAGVVVDADGRPLEGIEVLNAGDGPEALTVTTDAEGGFELDGLWEGTAWAFARAPGYRTGSVRAETGATDLTITLLPADARPDAPGEPPEDDLDARRALAEELVLEALDQVPPGETRVRVDLLAALARANPTLAEQMWREEGTQRESSFVPALALGLAETDADAAIDRLLEADASSRARGLLAVGRAVGELEPELAAEAFSLAATATGAMRREADQIRILAQAAEGLLLLGNVGGADVARQAEELVRTSEEDGRSRLSNIGIIARALALADVDEALAFVDVIREIDPENQYSGQRERALFQVACVVARSDPERALEIVDMAENYYGRAANHARLAWELHEADPAKALEYTRGVSNPLHGALAIGYLAPRQEDQALAWELIEEAAAPLAKLADGMAGRYGGSEYALVVARLALVAQEVQYPDVQRLVTLALMSRSPRPRWLNEERHIWDWGNLPGVLVWSDAEAARALLESSAEAPEAFDAVNRWHWNKVLRGMAAADPAWAAMKVRELGAADTDLQPRERWRWHIELARYLALTREEQMREAINGWLPGKWEDG